MRPDLVAVGLVALASAVAAAVGFAWHRPTRRRPWVLVVAALAIHAAATLVDAARLSHVSTGVTLFTSLNAGHLISTAVGFPALRDLLFHRAPEQDREAVVDAGVVSLAVGLVVWAVGYQWGSAPMDLDITAGALILSHVIVSGAVLRVAFSGLLALSAARWLAATIVIGQLSFTYAFLAPDPAPWVNMLLWAVAVSCPGVAALNRSMRDLGAPVAASRRGRPLSARTRMTLLGAGLVAVPAAMLLGPAAVSWPQRVLSVGLVATSVAVAWRMLGLVRQRDATAAELERANVELEQLAGRTR
ncbi:MAG TPA: hypothetical protein VK891_16420 [Euzebyales bacterium]|nr:hypothetical protein [Euzebyales bacterium]